MSEQQRSEHMTDSACKTLADRFEARRAKGLVDVKFYVTGADEATYEGVCEEVIRLYDAMDRGDYKPLVFNDSRKNRAQA